MNKFVFLAVALASLSSFSSLTNPDMNDEKYNIYLNVGLIPTSLPKATVLTYDENGNPNYGQLYGYNANSKEYNLADAIDEFTKVIDGLMESGIYQNNAERWKWELEGGGTQSISMAQRALMVSSFLSLNAHALITGLARYCQDLSKAVNLNKLSWNNLSERVGKAESGLIGITMFRDEIKKECEDTYKKANGELEKKIMSLQTDVAALKKTQSDIENEKGSIESIEKRLANVENSLSQLDASAFAKQTELTTLQAQVSSAQESVNTAIEGISQIGDTITGYSAQVTDLLSQIDNINKQLSNPSITQSERQALEESMNGISSQVSQINDSIKSLKSLSEQERQGMSEQAASISGLVGQIEAAEAALSELKSQRESLEQDKSGIQTELETAQARLKNLEDSASEQESKVNQNQQNINAASILLATLQKSVDAIGAGATKESVKEILQPLIVGGIVSPADCNYTNAMYKLVKYLGVDDSDGSVTNSGMTFVAPKVDGRQANDILDYLDMNGVIGYQYQSEDSGGSTNSPFSAKFESTGTNTIATFGAPVNWIDGETIKMDANGKYSAQVSLPVTTPWHWTTNGFVRPYVYAGNQIVTASGADVTSAGEYYVHVTMSQSQGGGYNVSAHVDTSSQVSEDSWTFWVGTLQNITHDVDGTLVTETVCTAELGTMPIILCYE